MPEPADSKRPDEAPTPSRGPTVPSDEALVRAALRLARIAPPEAEVEAMAPMVEPLRAAVERLYVMPGIEYAEPATTFTPPPE